MINNKSILILVVVAVLFSGALFVFNDFSNESLQLKEDIELYRISNQQLKSEKLNLKSELEAANKSIESIETQLQDIKDKPVLEVSIIEDESSPFSNILERTAKPDLFFITSHNDKDKAVCSDSELKHLDAWLRFHYVYKELKAASTSNDNSEFLSLFLLNANLSNRASIFQKSYSKALIDDLLQYSKKIQSVNEGEVILQRTHLVTDVKKFVQELYELGFPKSDSQCLTHNSVNVAASNNKYLSLSITYEEWMYSFWKRRLNDNLYQETELTLKLLSNILKTNSEADIPKTTFWRQEVIESDVMLQKFYSQFIVGRNYRGKGIVSVWTTNEIKPESLPDLYLIDTENNKHKLTHEASAQYPLEEQTTQPFMHTFLSDAPPKQLSSINFITTSNEDMFPSRFMEKPISDEEKLRLESLFEKEYFLKWKPLIGRWGVIKCSTNQYNKFENSKDIIFMFTKTCSNWQGEGVGGLTFTGIAKLDDNHNLQITNTYPVINGDIGIKKDFILDKDGDGNIEVILIIGYGVSSSEELVELQGNNWSIVQRLSDYSEGGYESFHELNRNQAHLKSSN
ncbi:MAG: hypothetical protein HRU20_22060 [Pseudomonadales bacterium]|nr:hypothetical protein [Pseudomonadales bacterium]